MCAFRVSQGHVLQLPCKQTCPMGQTHGQPLHTDLLTAFLLYTAKEAAATRSKNQRTDCTALKATANDTDTCCSAGSIS